MKKYLIFVFVITLLLLGSFVVYKSKYNSNKVITPTQTSPIPTIPQIEKETDEHGCELSQGYTWCEEKAKCLRAWEEECSVSAEEGIQSYLANKYNKPVEDVHITINKQTEKYASGSVLFGEGGPGEGGMFLAWKNGNTWEVVFDGNGNVNCDEMRQEYGFPDEILKPNFCD